MAHLPEVEVMRKDLEREVVGKRVKDVTVRSRALIPAFRNEKAFAEALQGCKITGVGRRGTRLLFDLDSGDTLVVRLGGQGGMTRETATEEAGEATWFVATFTTGGALHYSGGEDAELQIVPTEQLDVAEGLGLEGIDPLVDTFTWHSIGRQLALRAAPLKSLLVDESFVVGLGDLYADEILWSAGLSGMRRSDRLSAQEVRRLYRAILEVLYEAVKQGGTAEPEPDEDDDEADFGDHIKVFGRQGQPCARCRQPIAFSTLEDGESLYHCPNCQT